MSKKVKHSDSRQLRSDLNRLVRRARKVLDRAYLVVRGRQVLCRTLALLFLFALPLLLVELVRYLAGYASFGLRGWQYVALVVAGAGVFALGWLLRDFLRYVLPRRTTLGLFDRQLRLANRLATADEFIATRERTGFMQAAIDDAVGPVERAMGSKAQAIGAERRWPLSRGALLSVPATVCLLLLTIWLGAQERGTTGGELFAGTVDDLGASPDLSVVARVAEEDRRSGDERPVEETPGAGPGGTADTGAPESFDGSASQPGGQAALLESQSESSAGSSSGGLPSGAGSRPAGQAEGGGESSTGRQNPKAGAGRQSASRERQAGASETNGRQPAGGRESASGRGSSMSQQNRQDGSGREQALGQRPAGAPGSSGQQPDSQSGESAGSAGSAASDRSGDMGQGSVAAANSAAAQANGEGAQGAGEQADSRGVEQGDEAADGSPQESGEGGGVQAGAQEGQESSTEGQEGGEAGSPSGVPGQGGQPNAQVGPSGSSSEGGGVGGADATIKKNRGAAKAMLAVPTSDRLIGVRGDGPEQIRQEQSVPQEQQAAPVAASARTERGERIGTLQQTEVSGWSRQLVKNYFDRGGSATAGTPGEIASDTPSTTTDNSEGQQP